MPASPRGQRGHDRRLRRRAPRSPRGDRRGQAAAAELGARSAVVTFDRHPASVVRPESAPLLLTDLDQTTRLHQGDRRRLRGGPDVRRAPSVRARGGVRRAGARRLPQRSRRRGGGGLPLRQPAPRQRRAASRDGGDPWLRGRAGLGLVATTGDRTAVSSTAIRAARSPAATSRLRPRCSAARTRCGDQSSKATTGAASSGSRPRTWPCPPRSRCPRTASTQGGTSGPTARCIRPRSHSVAGRPSTLTSRFPARGIPPRVRRRPLRRARQGAVRGQAQRRGAVRLGRGPRRADEG